MPGKLQNKRSSTLNNPPAAGTLAAGEIALNTNADSANLHFEDAGGGVRSIGADPTAAGTYVRNVSGANEVGTWTELEIPPGTIIDTDPPVDPPDGQLFFNEDNQTLWVWSEAQSTWAPAVPQVPTGGGGDYSSAELNEKVFFINEQEVNEDYTVTGTDNAGSFGPIDIANGKNVTIADGGTWTVCGGAGRSVDPAGLWSRDGSTGTLTPANPGDDIETTGDLSAADGEFSGSVTAAGIGQFGSTTAGNYGILAYSNAIGTNTYASVKARQYGSGRVFAGCNADDDVTSAISAEGNLFTVGSIATEGELTAPYANLNYRGGRTGKILGIYSGVAGEDPASPVASISNNGGMNASYLISTMPNGEDKTSWSTFAGRDGSDGNKVTCNITAEGNVTAAGYVEIGASYENITIEPGVNPKISLASAEDQPDSDDNAIALQLRKYPTKGSSTGAYNAFEVRNSGGALFGATIRIDGGAINPNRTSADRNVFGGELNGASTSFIRADGVAQFLAGGLTIQETSNYGAQLITDRDRFLCQSISGGAYLTQGGTSWVSNSDKRLKKDLVKIEDGLNKVSQLNGYTGHFKTDSDDAKRRSFLIAQEVQAVLPEAVDDLNPAKLGVSYTDLIPLLVSALNEAKDRIESLEAKLTALSGPSTTDIQEGN